MTRQATNHTKRKPDKPPRNCTFLWNQKDRERLQALQDFLEVGRQEVIRLAIKEKAEKEGVA